MIKTTVIKDYSDIGDNNLLQVIIDSYKDKIRINNPSGTRGDYYQ